MIDSPANSICVCCGQPISDSNDSREHVIPNAIGGRLKTRGFICELCNNTAGHSWDAALSDQLNSLSLFFQITRETGAPPAELVPTTAGEELLLQPGGGFLLAKPVYIETETEAGKRITITARTVREARRMAAGAKRKHPSIDFAASLKDVVPTRAYPEGMVKLNLTVGGPVAGRSIVKSAAAMAHVAGVPITSCDAALAYLRDPAQGPCFGFYYASDPIAGRPAGIPLHCVAVSGDPATGLLLGYVEYFGGHRIVVGLSEAYHGPAIRHAHAVDPRTGQSIAVSVVLPLSPQDLRDTYEYKKIPEGAVHKAFGGVIPPAIQRQFETEQQRVVREAVEYAFGNCGAREGEVLTEEHTRRLSSLMMEKLTPFLVHAIRRHPRPFPDEQPPGARADDPAEEPTDAESK